MSCLTGPAIREAVQIGAIEVTPYDPGCVGPNSLDVHLHPMLRVYRSGPGDEYDPGAGWVLDSRRPPQTANVEIPDDGFVLRPGELYLARTVERTYTPCHVPKLGGRSSTGRLGLNIHQTAGFGDVGFDGTWTLELSVVRPVRVYPNQRIGQIWFFSVEGDREQYRGQYQGQVAPGASGGLK